MTYKPSNDRILIAIHNVENRAFSTDLFQVKSLERLVEHRTEHNQWNSDEELALKRRAEQTIEDAIRAAGERLLGDEELQSLIENDRRQKIASAVMSTIFAAGFFVVIGAHFWGPLGMVAGFILGAAFWVFLFLRKKRKML